MTTYNFTCVKVVTEISGSYGTIVAERATGVIVSYQPDTDNDAQYADIVRIDPDTLIADEDDTDILAVGFWDNKGRYVPALIQNEQHEYIDDPNADAAKPMPTSRG